MPRSKCIPIPSLSVTLSCAPAPLCPAPIVSPSPFLSVSLSCAPHPIVFKSHCIPILVPFRLITLCPISLYPHPRPFPSHYVVSQSHCTPIPVHFRLITLCPSPIVSPSPSISVSLRCAPVPLYPHPRSFPSLYVVPQSHCIPIPLPFRLIKLCPILLCPSPIVSPPRLFSSH